MAREGSEGRQSEALSLPILQAAIPDDQRRAAGRPLPGIQPCNGTDWLTIDAAYVPQMAERERLLSERPKDVLAVLPEAEKPARELLEQVLVLLAERRDFDVGRNTVARPDGHVVALDRSNPLATLGQLVTEDLCILQKSGAFHVLTGAVLCFPAGWTLTEKIGRPLTDIHDPVAEYDTSLARRVQRLFDGVQVGRPIWRANLLRYDDPALFQPRKEGDPRHARDDDAPFERSERQVIFRLPKSDAVIFTIHTSVARAANRP